MLRAPGSFVRVLWSLLCLLGFSPSCVPLFARAAPAPDGGGGGDGEMTVIQALHHGVSLQNAGDLDGAASLYGQVLAHDPAQADAHGLLGLVHYSRGDHKGAATLLRAAIALRPAEERFLSNLGEVLRAGGDANGASAALRQAVALNPTYSIAWLNLAVVERERRDLPAAETALRALLGRAAAGDSTVDVADAARQLPAVLREQASCLLGVRC